MSAPPAPPAPRLWVCVERYVEQLVPAPPRPPVGWVIDLATRARWGGPAGSAPAGGWAFDGGPATHAFTVVRGEDGRLFRIDATAPQVTCEPLPGTRHDQPRAEHFSSPTRVWAVLDDERAGVSTAPGVAEAWALYRSGTKYDFVQVTTQALAFILPPPAAALVDYAGPSNKIICTEEACRSLRACGGQARFLANDVMDRDHYPEELARKMELAEGPWLQPVALG